MGSPVDMICRPVEQGHVPYWRLVLRCCSQLCFQSNELTGLFFLAAVLVASPIAAAYLLVAAIMAPAGRMLLRENDPALSTGLPGLNPCLMALAVPAFFQTGWTNVGMWMVLVLSVACVIVLVRICVSVLPFPTLVFPFVVTFWSLYAWAPSLDLVQPAALQIPEAGEFHPVQAVLTGLAQGLFLTSIWSGLLYSVGVLLSNWRHGLIAVLGATIGTAVSYYYYHADPADPNVGLCGSNGVLTAVAVFIFCGDKLRLSILGALVATLLTPFVAGLGVPALSAPFVLTTWLMIGLGWIEEHWVAVPPAQRSQAAA